VIEKRLHGFNIDETMEFLSSKDVHISLDEAMQIQQRLSGHPLALNMFCEVFKGKDFAKVLEQLPELGLLGYFWNEIYQGLDEREQTLLQCMSVFRHPIPVKAIMSISRIRGIRGILYSLERKMVVGRLDGRYFLHEIIRDLCYRFIDNPKEMHRRAAEYYLSEKSIEALLEAVYHMIKAEDFQMAARIIRKNLESEEYNCIERGYVSQYRDLLKSISSKDTDEETWCWILYGKGRVHLARGEFMRAIENLSKMLAIGERLSNAVLIEKALRHLGKAYLGLGNLSMAEKFFMRSLSLLKDIGNLRSLGSAFLEMAMLYLYKGDLDKMKYLLDMGLETCEEAEDERNVAIGYYHYAGLHEMRNNWEEAIECCEKSLKMFETIGDILWIATLHAELAFIKTFLRRFDEALEHFAISIDIFEKTHVHNKLVEAYSDRALLYIEMGYLEKAEKDCEKALRLKSATGELPYYGATYRALGIIATAKKDWIEAERYFRQSVKLLSTVHKFHLAETYLAFALMYEHKGDVRKAVEYLNKSLGIFRRLNSKEEIKRAQNRIKHLMLSRSIS